MTTSGADILTFTATSWTESQQSDNEPTVIGSSGTYTLDGVKLRLIAEGYPDDNYELTRREETIQLRWVRNRDPDPDVAIALTLFTAFPFHRTS